jgi:LAO/AO transport system kinase
MINEATLAESIRRLRQGERATLAQAMTLWKAVTRVIRH